MLSLSKSISSTEDVASIGALVSVTVSLSVLAALRLVVVPTDAGSALIVDAEDGRDSFDVGSESEDEADVDTAGTAPLTVDAVMTGVPTLALTLLSTEVASAFADAGG